MRARRAGRRARGVALGIVAVLGGVAPAQQPQAGGVVNEDVDPPLAAEPEAHETPTVDDIRRAAEVLGLSFTDEELALMRRGVVERRGELAALRTARLDNAVAPMITFSPLAAGFTPHVSLEGGGPRPGPAEVSRPDDPDDLAFADVATLSELVRTRQVSCVELAEFFLERLARVDEQLHCVIRLLPDRALAQARALDAELDRGEWRGPLHGIPWGAKDLLAVAGAPTTWGAKPFEDQVIDEDAAVVRRLDDAGAVLVAKLTLGALAWGDVWFGGTTRSPWNPEQGSSGSSAGSAAAVAAGALPFAIGSETLGSIVSPSARCGNSSLRPTFGTVSRHGAMALSWTMDKLGPMCRSARDAQIVFAAIRGPDRRDAPTIAYDAPFADLGRADVDGWRVGYVEASFAGSAVRGVLDELTELGAELVPVELPSAPVDAMLMILSAEAAEAFHELTLDGRDDLLVRQVDQAWPNVFRQARLIPAVEYLRAQRLRRRLVLETELLLRSVDVLVHPSFDATLSITNLTGHPTFVAPFGARDDGAPLSVSFTTTLYGEPRLLAFVEAWQAATDHHRRRPPVR